MCGLAGLYLPDGASAVTADLGAMLKVMRHRGPDGQGIHVSEDRRFQAGFVRLAIIDLATGDQPLVEPGGEHVFLGNGEIYNYREIRAELAARGHVFRTQGDMEAGLRLFLERGEGFVHDLNGMYALAHYGRRDHRLLLVRDRLGIKPLYWARLNGGGILFASEVKALFASGLLEPEVDPAAVSSYLTHGYVPAPATLFRGVNKLPPGSVLTAGRDGAVNVERYWRPSAAPDLPADEPAIRRHLADLLADSVRLQLRSDVPVGALLSGGVDSGLMVALAARQLDRPLKTYTVRFAGAAYDESPLARMVAERYGTDHTEFELATDTAAALLPRLAWHCDEPLFDAALLPNHLISEVLGRETRVVLNGTGGDELFAGYGRYFPLPVEARYTSLPGWLRHGLVEPAIALVAPMTAWRLARAGRFTSDGGGYLNDHTTQFPPPLRRLIGNIQARPQPAQRAAYAAFQGPAQSAALAADLQTYLPEDLLLLLDRTTMAASVEGRVPFLDHRLVEAALAVPPSIRTPGGRQKALERAMAAEYLPDSVLNAPKQGFASPVPAWMEGTLGKAAARLLTQRRALDRGFWTLAGIGELAADPRRHAFRLYALVMLELTIRLHGELRLDAPPSATLEEVADAG
ncbi:asparagine synthase (glutamine-hydrolyzing) [Magnetospirillum sp. UT-4]|uniref:asparagine synthase (glutamine-hydrolyzing) n=1 Tax=Magnetospirillum sp. UT-4 TaxID=2681467 RepID=UPI00137DAD25|nr:asparagine synthase (glutamine-hydrolyzing) [Magnetospirillum sp. UT-4]CAA7621709.1 Asparagine synthetase [Magnetospirillum sp. UT-4]